MSSPSSSFPQPKIQHPISIPPVFSTIKAPYQPKMVALLNGDVEFRVAKIKGKFVWHKHLGTDELFYVLSGGPLIMNIRHTPDDPTHSETIEVKEGEMFVVPKGVQHCPDADVECQVLVVERAGELNTGDLGVNERTVVIEDARGSEP